jgi:type I restriction enzyme S subunit
MKNTKNKNIIKLGDLLETKHKVGKEIGSESYMPKSQHRFLKTANISKNFLLAESTFEYCKPTNKIFPKKNEILIAKDGGGNGLGEACLYPYENKENLDSLSAGVVAINIIAKKLYYVFGMLKSQHFKDHVDLNTAQGSTIRHSKLAALDYEIPFPTKNNNPEPQKIEQLVSLITQNIIDKEVQIKAKNKKIDEIIEGELKENQNPKNSFKYSYPKISEIKQETRLDSGLYEKEVKEINFLIKNYKSGSFSISDNFHFCRGQNLQVSQIGESYYSDSERDGFYRMFTNIEMQDDRTISGYRWLGNKNKLTTLPDNAIMLAADGMIVGRAFFYDIMENTITNIHPWIITPKLNDYPIFKRVFLCLFLSYLKNISYLEKIKDKSNGGGLKKEHLDRWIKIPNFSDLKQQEIAKEYYNKIDKNQSPALENYLQKETARNQQIGIFQLNMEIFTLRKKLEEIIDKIINETPIEINLTY